MIIPKEFWRNMDFDEFKSIHDAGELNREQCARLWRMEGKVDDPPDRMTLMVNKADLMRIFPPKT